MEQEVETAKPKPEPRLFCTSRVLKMDEQTRRVTHVISTAKLDRSNRIVEPAGWSLANFRANNVVFADHEYGIERAIGNGYDVKIDGDALVATTEFAEEGLGNVAFRLVQAGVIKAWSVGWIGQKAHALGEEDGCAACAAALKKKVSYGMHYTQQELLEYSLVAIPANPDAVMGLCTAGLVAGREADEWIESFRTPEASTQPEPGTLETMPVIERSSAFYTAVFNATRTNAVRAAARRSASHFRGAL